jgi:hypothetical protein
MTETLDRSVPSRELDAEVAQVLGWREVATHPMYTSAWSGYRPAGGRLEFEEIPGYTTDTGSRWWGEMLAWVTARGQEIQITVNDGSAEVYATFMRGEPIFADAIGHALARVVLSLHDQERLNA